MPSIVIRNEYETSNQPPPGLAKVGASVIFKASAKNTGNVDVNDVTVSNELSKSVHGELLASKRCANQNVFKSIFECPGKVRHHSCECPQTRYSSEKGETTSLP